MRRFIYKLTPSCFKISYYKLRGGRPWSGGYLTFKFRYIKRIINNQEIMEGFKNLESLPEGYGYALDERVIEYPWVFSKISSKTGRLLDAGSTLNFKEILEFKALKNKKITIVNLNPEANCFWQKGISYVFADIRSLPFKDDYFDHIVCISTLEHIGMDNTIIYTDDLSYQENRSRDYLKAVLELRRILKPNGSLLITVPFGRYQNFKFLQQFNGPMIDEIIKIFNGQNKAVCYYKYSKKGWNISDEESCGDAEYFDIRQTKYFDKKSSFGFDADFAAASRAVACLELIK